MLKLSDGMEFEFDTSGPLRVEERTDGLYVVGGRILVAVGSREEADELIGALKKQQLCVHCGEREYDPEASFATTDLAGRDAYIQVCRECVEKYGHASILMKYEL
jgi:hypothetical protein